MTIMEVYRLRFMLKSQSRQVHILIQSLGLEIYDAKLSAFAISHNLIHPITFFADGLIGLRVAWKTECLKRLPHINNRVLLEFRKRIPCVDILGLVL